MQNQELLGRVHYLRMKAHYGKKWAEENAFADDRWPKSRAEWEQTGHGAPWDTNVHMAEFHLKLALEIAREVAA